jgi:hypothetical protein
MVAISSPFGGRAWTRTCVALAALTWAHGLTPPQLAQELAGAQTLREALIRAGLPKAVAAPDAPPLDRRLVSWAGTSSADVFVAGYYFEDELPAERLYVSLFDPAEGRWRTVRMPEGHDTGSVTRIAVTRTHVLVNGHWTPSAARAHVLDRRTLAAVASVDGYRLRAIRDGTLLYGANMLHFAPNHQERLMTVDLATGTSHEIYPGTAASTTAAAYRTTIRAAWRGLTTAEQSEVAGVYGPVDDFDRSIGDVIEHDDGRGIAFVVTYRSDRLRDRVAPKTVVIECRSVGIRWQCSEQR